jgi:hypothetical protein
MIYSLYIFDRHCSCIYHQAWNRSTNDPQPLKAGVVDKLTEEDSKLVYGTVFSLKNIINKLSTNSQLTNENRTDTFLSYMTNSYKLHYFETSTSIRFCLLTDPNFESCTEILSNLYTNVYVEYVTKNALINTDSPIHSELFRANLQSFITSIPGYQ